MINSRKKGFTLVELVIVIAVIAILAAVLIPTFSSLIKKANTANDTVVAKNMNTALAEYTALNGKPENFDEVLEAIEEAGYVIANLNAKAEGNLYGWDEKNNQIVYIDKDGNTIYQNVDFNKGDVKIVVTGQTTLPGDFTATIDVTKPETAKALEAALESGISVTLVKDIEMKEEIFIPEGVEVVLDLGGKKLTTKQLNPGEPSQKSLYINVDEGGALTIQNGTFEGRGIMNYGTLVIKDGTTINALDLGGGCIKNKATGNVVIEGGTFNVDNFTDWDKIDKGGACAVETVGGSILIKGGTFTSKTEQYLICALNGGTITIDNGTFTAYRGALDAENGEIIVNNGTFKVTHDAQSGWIAYTEGAGKIVLNAGEYSTVTGRKFTGNVTGAAAN